MARPIRPVGIQDTDSMVDGLKKVENAFNRINERLKRQSTNINRIVDCFARVVEAAEKTQKAVEKTDISLIRVGKTVTRMIAKPFKIAFNCVKGIFGFLKKIGSLTFGTLFKLFAGLAAITKINSLMKILGQEFSGKSIGSTGTKYRALSRVEGAYGMSGLTETASGMQNLLNNPLEFSKLAQWGFLKGREHYNNMDPADAAMEMIQDAHKFVMGLPGQYKNLFARQVLGGSGLIDINKLQGIGKTFDQFRGTQHDIMKYYKQQIPITKRMIGVSIEYNKVMYELEDLWQSFAVELGPILLTLMRAFKDGAAEILRMAVQTGLVSKVLKTVEWAISEFNQWYDNNGQAKLQTAFQALAGFVDSIPIIWDDMKKYVVFFCEALAFIAKEGFRWAADAFGYEFEMKENADGSKTFNMYKKASWGEKFMSSVNNAFAGAEARQDFDMYGSTSSDALDRAIEASRAHQKVMNRKELAFSTNLPGAPKQVENATQAVNEKLPAFLPEGAVMRDGKIYFEEELNIPRKEGYGWAEYEKKMLAKNPSLAEKGKAIEVIMKIEDKTSNGVAATVSNIRQGQ